MPALRWSHPTYRSNGWSPQAPRHLEAVAFHQRGVAEHFLRRTIGSELPAVQQQHAVTEIDHDVQFMCGDHLTALELFQN